MNGRAVSLSGRLTRLCVLIAVVVFLQTAVIHAQASMPDYNGIPACALAAGQSNGTLSGTVSDSTGARVAGAKVTAECGSFRKQTTTNSEGTYP